MEKILEIIQMLTPRKDRLEHFFWGFVYTIVGFVITYLTGWQDLFMIIPFTLALIKEIRDIKKSSGFDTVDFLFTVIPPITVWLIIILNK